MAQADRETLRKAGLDFIVLEPQAPASSLQEEELGLLLRLRDDLTDIQLRTLDSVYLDALYVEHDEAPATILGQMELRRLSGLTRTVLLVNVKPDAQQEELVVLRDAGVSLVAVEPAADALRHLRGVIDGLPRRRRPRKDDRAEVTLPRAARPTDEGEELEEEE